MTGLPQVIKDGPVQQNFEKVMSELGLKLPLSSVSAYIQTLLDDANAATARATLGTDAAGAQRPPAGPETNLKVIRGIVNTAGAGTIVEGSGFTLTRHGTGDVTITFSTGFSNEPAITATSGNWATQIQTYSTTAVRLNNFNTTTGAFVDAVIHFQAIGPA
jgi:hypothetical protein